MNPGKISTAANHFRNVLNAAEPVFYALAATMLIGQILFLHSGMVTTAVASAVLVGEVLGVMAVCGWKPLNTLLSRRRSLPAAGIASMTDTGAATAITDVISAKIVHIASRLPLVGSKDAGPAGRNDDRSSRAA